MDFDIYSLLTADEPTAQQKAAQLSAALRGKEQASALNRGMSMVAGLGQNSLLQGLGRSSGQAAEQLSQQAQFGQGQLAQAGNAQAGRALQKTIAAEKRRQELYDENSRRTWQEGRDKERFTQELMQAYVLAGMRNRERSDEKDEARKARKEMADDKAIADDIETLSKRTEGAGALKGDLNTLISFAGKEDIPGVGTIEGRLPNIFTSKDGTTVRQSVKGIVGNLIKERSGTAASDKEVERIMTELGMGDGATEQQFRQGLGRLTEQAKALLLQKEAGARPEALQLAKQRGLMTSADIPSYRAAPPAAAPAPQRVRLQDGTVWERQPDGSAKRVQ